MFNVAKGGAEREGTVTKITGTLRGNGADVLFAVLCFFLGRARIFGVISPLAVAGAAPVFLEGGKFYVYAIFSVLGLITCFDALYTIKYFIAIAVLWLINLCLTRHFKESGKKAEDLTKYAVAGVVVLLAALLPEIFRGLTLYALLMCTLEGVLAFSLSFILAKGRSVITERKSVMTTEELVSAAFLAGGVIMGAVDIWIGWISLRYLFCGFVTLLIAVKAGSAAAASSGIILGILMNAAGYEEPVYAVVISLTGLCCGFIKSRFKIVSGVCFTALPAVASLYFGIFRLELLISFALAAAFYVILPTDRLLSGVRETLSPASGGTEEYYRRIKNITAGKLKSSSMSFQKLAAAYSGIHEARSALTKEEVNNLLDDITSKTCKGCVKSFMCWEQDLYETCRKAYEVLKKCDIDTDAEAAAGAGGILDFCIKGAEFYDTAVRYLELYKNDLRWKNRLNESRHMAAEQLNAVSVIVGELAEGMEFIQRFDWDMEKKVKLALLKVNIDVENVVIALEKDGGFEIEITQKSCGFKRKCSEKIIPVVSNVLGRRIRKHAPESECLAECRGGGRLCRLRLVEEQRMSVAYGVAKEAASKSDESGDCYSHMENKNGRVILALSDGMGTGKRALEESRATVELFEDFMESGFDKSMAVRLINSALLLKSTAYPNNDNFSTLDVCAIDLRDGRAEFIKVGASSTFILRGGDVETIRSYSLPVGILDSVEPETTGRRLKDGDIVIMMTDGVLDTSDGHKENLIISSMKKIRDSNPQNIAERLLEQAKKNYAGGAKDDMTILVARIWEKVLYDKI